MKSTKKTTMFVAALAAMILGQAGVSAADSTPAILKAVKAKQTLHKGQMKKVKGEWYPYNCYYSPYYNNYAPLNVSAYNYYKYSAYNYKYSPYYNNYAPLNVSAYNYYIYSAYNHYGWK